MCAGWCVCVFLYWVVHVCKCVTLSLSLWNCFMCTPNKEKVLNKMEI